MGCTEFDDYVKWYREVALPRLEAWSKHAADCPECFERLVKSRDTLAIELITTSDEKLKSILKGGT